MYRLRHNSEPEAEILGTLASHEVVIDRSVSHNHLVEDLPAIEAARVLENALWQIDAQGRDYLVEVVECGEATLRCHCVATTATDRIVYAHRHDRAGPTRFVLDREPEPTNHVIVALLRDKDKEGTMILLSAM